MKMRPQQQSLEGTSIINISCKQNALLTLTKRSIGNEDFFKEGFSKKVNCRVDDFERDESPVSVISHSATIVSQPSSSCTSMEHHLSHLISNPNSIHRQRIANPNHLFPLSQEQISMGTSAASTSEDDSSAYNRLITQNSTKTSKRRSPHSELVDHVTDSCKSDVDDDDHMMSIGFQGLQEDPMVLRENFLRSHGTKLTAGEEEKQYAVDKKYAKLKHQYGGWKEEQKLNRSTSNAQKEVVAQLVRPIINLSASEIVQNHADSNSRAGAAPNVGKVHEEGLLAKGPQRTANKTNSTAPNLVSRQRSINSSKSAVPSKWDDAEKWLCYDNQHGSHHNKPVKTASVISRQTLPSNHSTPIISSGGGINKHPICKEDHPSPGRAGVIDQSSASSRGKLSVYQGHECKNNVAHSTVAKYLMQQNTNITSGRGAHYISVDAPPRDNHITCSSQNSSSSDIVDLDTSKRKRNETIPQVKASQKSKSDCTSSGEIANLRYAHNSQHASISMSDGEINQINCQQSHIASQMSASTGSTPGEKKMKDSTRPASNRNWMRSNSDALGTPCNCEDYLSSGGELMSRAKPAGIFASDGELCENYASHQQSKSSASYAQRFKQHQILQKLRSKCSPRKGARAITQSSQSEKVEVGGSMASTKANSQKEFVVQTPTHGRSASMKDACTEVSPSLSRRDMGTQITPPASSPITPKCTSPLQNTSPARHNTPTRTSSTSDRQGNDINTSSRGSTDDGMSLSAHISTRCNNVSALELESCHWAKLELRELPSGAQTSEKNSDMGSVYNEGSPAAYGLEEEIVDDNDGDEAKGEVNSGGGIMKSLGVLEARAAAWEEAERVKFTSKYKRKEARIKAWETLQKAKAETDLQKLEVKLERLRSKATEKVMSRVAAAEKRAEEMRAAAEAQQLEQMRKARERACNLRRNALFPGGFAVCFARNYMP